MESSSFLNQVDAGDCPWSDEGAFLSAIVETQSDLATVELDVRMIMQMVAERTQKLTGADGASVQIVEGDHLVCRAVSGMMEGREGTKLSLTSSLAGHAARTGRYVHCEDSHADPRVDREATDRMGIRSLIVVPIFRGSQAVGILNVSSASRGAFVPGHVSALRLMAGLVSAALAHAGELEDKKSLLAERTASLAALRDSEERFRSAFDHAAVGMALVALNGRWMQVNRSLCEILGYAEEELLVLDFQSITHPDDLNADLAHVRRLVAGEVRDYKMVKRYIHRRGQIVWVLLSVSLVRDADDKPLHFIAQIQDITRRKRAEDALRTSEEEYRATFEMAGIGKGQVDLESGRFVRVNGKFCEMMGYSADELLTKTFGDLTHPDDLVGGLEMAKRMRHGESLTYNAEKRYVRKDGRIVWALLNATVIYDDQDRPTRAVSTFQDISERKRSEWLERDRRRVLEMVARNMPLPEVLTQLAAALEPQLPATLAAVMVLQDGNVQLHGSGLSHELQQALQEHALTLVAGLAAGTWESADGCGVTFVGQDDAWKGLRPVAAKNGIAACWTTAIRAADSSVLGVLTVFCREALRPTTAAIQTLDMAAKLAAICIEHHNTSRQLTHLVRHDSLTGLANRLMFHDNLHQALELARRRGDAVGVMLLDVDKFKSINDSYGHDAGDALLQQFALRLSGRLRDTDTMARLGGDEFAVVLPGLKGREDAAAVARKLVESSLEPFYLGDRPVRAASSIGIALFPADGTDAGALMKKADEALYRVKARGRNGSSF